MSAQLKSLFCADCGRELRGHGVEKRDGRTVCKPCARKIQRATQDRLPLLAVGRAGTEMYAEQDRLFNPSGELVRNVEGFMIGGAFHPIRTSEGYNEFLAGDFDTDKQHARKQIQRLTSERQSAREWEGFERQEEKRARRGSGQRAEKRIGLAQFVRKTGGMVAGGAFAGEAARLSPKELGTTGLINKRAKSGHHVIYPELMMDRANEAGYRDGNGQKFSAVGDFIEAVEMDARAHSRGPASSRRRGKSRSKEARLSALQNPSLTPAIVARLSPVLGEEFLQRIASESRARANKSVNQEFAIYENVARDTRKPHEARAAAAVILGALGQLRSVISPRSNPFHPLEIVSHLAMGLTGVHTGLALLDRYHGKRDREENPSKQLTQERLNVILRILRVQDEKFSLTDDEKAAQFDYLSRKSDVELARLLRLHLEAVRQDQKLSRNSDLFGAGAIASAQRVTRTPLQVTEKGTGERGEVIEILPSGFLKVQWRNRAKPTLIKRSQLMRAKNPHKATPKYARTHFMLAEKRHKKAIVIIAKAQSLGNEAYKAQRDGDTRKAAKLFARANRLIAGVKKSGSLDTPLGVLPNGKHKTVKVKRSNPQSLDRFAEMFHGKVSGARREVMVSSRVRNKNIGRLGALPYLKMVDRPRGHGDPKHACGQCAIVLNPANAFLCATPQRKLVLGGSDFLRAGKQLRAQFLAENPGKHGDVNLGRVEVLFYDTEEKHSDSGVPILYYHPTAEETKRNGDRPAVCIDPDGMLYLKGGRYRIERRGIVN